MAIYTEKHLLPSRGILGEGYPSELTIRNMTTSDEKVLLGSTVDALDNVLRDCVVSPKGINLDDLISPDKHFLLMKLRIMSYGADYFVSAKCPSCGATPEYRIKLDELPVDLLPETFEEPYDTFTLPQCKSTISLKIPRMKELNDADTKARRFHKKFVEAKGDMAYIYRLMTNILHVDGAVMPSADLQTFIEELCVMDTGFLKNRINKLKVGYDTEIIEECPKCHADHKFELPVTYDFFRTRYID